MRVCAYCLVYSLGAVLARLLGVRGGGDSMGGAFQKKLVGQNGSLTGCSAMLMYKTRI